MSLLFGAVNTDRVNCGSGTTLDNLTALTLMAWVYPTSNVSNKGIVNHFQGAADSGWELYTADALGNIALEWAGDTYCFGQSTTTPLSSLNTWAFLAGCATFTAKPRLYTGTLAALASEVTYDVVYTAGITRHDDAARNLMLGNKDTAATNLAFTGRIAWVGVWNRELALGEVQAQQFAPHVTSGCVGFFHLGFNGTGTQADWSGNGNNGTVTGATVAAHVPLRPPFGGRAGWRGNYKTPAAGWGRLLGQKRFRRVYA